MLRFGSELVFSICELYGVEVVILNKTPDSSPEEELVKDVLEIITVFSAKLHSMRSRKIESMVQLVLILMLIILPGHTVIAKGI